MPRNNEYLQTQSKNAALRGGPSPAQGCDAPAVQSASFDTAMRLLSSQRQTAALEATATATSNSTTTAAATSNSTGLRSTSPKVRLLRLKVSDVETMETSLKGFVKTSPYLARKLGVFSGDDSGSDMFTQMKADGESEFFSFLSISLF